jgi:hypothetical protein
MKNTFNSALAAVAFGKSFVKHNITVLILRKLLLLDGSFVLLQCLDPAPELTAGEDIILEL